MVASGQARQKACPLSNRGFDPESELKVHGVQVTFCCHGFRSRVTQADADKQLEACFGRKALGKAFIIKKDSFKEDS